VHRRGSAQLDIAEVAGWRQTAQMFLLKGLQEDDVMMHRWTKDGEHLVMTNAAHFKSHGQIFSWVSNEDGVGKGIKCTGNSVKVGSLQFGSTYAAKPTRLKHQNNLVKEESLINTLTFILSIIYNTPKTSCFSCMQRHPAFNILSTSQSDGKRSWHSVTMWQVEQEKGLRTSAQRDC